MKIKHLFQAQGVSANGQLTNIGASQSPVLAGLINQSWDLAQLFNVFFKTALIAGAMLAVLRLGYAGFIYMTTDSFGALGNAKQIIQDTIIGLLLLLSIWLILNQINPNLLNLNILQSVPGVPTTAAPTSAATSCGAGFTYDYNVGCIQQCGERQVWDGTRCVTEQNSPPGASGYAAYRDGAVIPPGLSCYVTPAQVYAFGFGARHRCYTTPSACTNDSQSGGSCFTSQ